MLRAPRRAPLASLALACLVFCLLAASCSTLGAAGSARSSSAPRARAATAFQIGVADEQAEMFADPLWQRLHTKITRYIAPYDAVIHPQSLAQATSWIRWAEAQHQQILIAFYHSEYTPTHLPSVAEYAHDVKKFIKRFPNVHQYESWNEANRGNVRYSGESYNSPTAVASAEYYVTLRHICIRHCTIVGLDLLDQPEVAPSLEYLAEFKAALHHWRIPTPSIWGLHNYSDTNRFSSSRTRAVLAAVPGEVWLTETGGIVKFGTDFPNYGGSGLYRASKAISYMFALAATNSRIKRLYIYQWSGERYSGLFDAGLTDYFHKPRPGYVVVCAHMHVAKCYVKVSSH
jgi:hypothetical protein